MHDFIYGAIGGGMIGLAATILYLVLGRIMGVSGIVGEAFFSRLNNEQAWRWLFLLGILIGVVLSHRIFAINVPAQTHDNLFLICMAGFLVGFGVKLGSGCTSGHGICGLARFSRRSLAATLCFMASAMFTVFVMRHTI